MSMKRLVATSVAFAVLVTLAAQAVPAPAAAVRCAGCKTEHFLIEHLKDPYAAASGCRMLPGPSGNKKAISLLAEHQLDFAYTCKPHGALAKKFGLDAALTRTWVSTAIARDPIVVVVHPSSGVKNLSIDQLKAVFSGQVTNWRNVGGADLPIVAAILDESVESGVVTVFKELTVGEDQPLLAGAKRLPSPSQLGHFAQMEAGAVTFMAYNAYQSTFGSVVAVEGVAPEKAAIVAGSYPLSVTYHIVHDTANGAEATRFLAYLATPAGMALINQMMVVLPQKPTVLP